MEKRIKTTDYELTPEVSSYLDERLAAMAKAFGEDPKLRFEVELGRATGHTRHGDNVWFIEIDAITSHGSRRSSSHAASIKEAIDEVRDEVIRQERSGKRLHRRIIRKSGAALKSLLRFGK